MGAGGSTAPSNQDYYSKSAVDVAIDLYAAVTNFFNFDTAPCNFKSGLSKDLYIFGEQYGAKFAVALADIFIDAKSNFNLKLALGNPWIDPVNQIGQLGLQGISLGVLDT